MDIKVKNRSALIIIHRQPYYDWIHKFDKAHPG